MGPGREGKAARRSAPTAPCLRARDMPRRTLLPPGPPQLGRPPAGQLLRTAREAVGQSPSHAACQRRVGAEDTPPWGPVGAPVLRRPFPRYGNVFLPFGTRGVSLRAGRAQAEVTGDGSVPILESLHLPSFFLCFSSGGPSKVIPARPPAGHLLCVYKKLPLSALGLDLTWG